MKVEHLTAGDHRLGQGEGLGTAHPADANRHEPGGHLIVGDLAAQVPREQEIDLFRRVLAAVALVADDLQRLHRGTSFHIPAVT